MRARLFLLSLVGALSLLRGSSAAQDREALTLEAIFGSEFQTSTVENPQWAADGSAFTFTERNPDTGLLDIHEHRVATGGTRPIVAGDALRYDGSPVGMSRYRWTADRNYLLITGPETLTWQSTIEAPYYVYDWANGSLRALADNDATLRNVHLSPDGRRVGYVFDNNIYVSDLKTGATHSVTTDDSPDILNGVFDYVTAQAFRNANGWLWSPDGRKIAFWRLDIEHMKVFYIVDELSKYNRVLPLKYPEVGERNALLQVGVVDIDTRKVTWMDIGDEADVYVPRIAWTNSSRTLSIQRLSRSHKKMELLFGDVETGQTRVVVTDTDPCWVDVTNDLIFFTEQDRFVWTSEKSGYRHAYLYDYDGNVVKQLTRGEWEISSLAALDEEGSWLYFYGKKDSFVDQHVYRVRLDGTEFERVSQEPGWYEWSVSPDGKTVIEFSSDARTLPRVTLRESDGRQLRVLEQNRIAALEKYQMVGPEFLTVTTSDGVVLNAYMIKPSDFDPSKKYPVVAYGYGNAGSQVVVNRWEDTQGLWHRYMADKGYIVFALDNRTTAGRGKAAKNLTYGHYAKWALHDQLEGVNYLKSLPYVDDSRLGFWGWSGGGYLACLLMTKGAPHFKTAVSVAPVIDLERYMSIGVERWMGFLEDNEKGYASTNLLNYADRLQGNLLLVHGTGDENVKFAFTLQFANALIAENKQFDMMVYPNRHHGIHDARLHLFTKITNYFLKNL